MNNCIWFVVIERLSTVNPGFERVNMGDLSDFVHSECVVCAVLYQNHHLNGLCIALAQR